MIPTMENLEITRRFYDELTAIQVRKDSLTGKLTGLEKMKTYRASKQNEYLQDLKKNVNLQDLKRN